MRKIDKFIEDILIIFLIVVCSFQKIFLKYTTYLDDILIIVFLFYVFFRNLINKSLKINIKTLIVVSSFFAITLMNVVWKKYNLMAYVEEIFKYLKHLIVLSMFLGVDIDNKRFKKFMNVFICVNFISAIYGIAHYMLFDEIGYQIGDKFRNNRLRVAGLSGHPIYLGFVCMFLITYIYENLDKNNIKFKDYLYIIVFAIVLFLTQSRLPICLLLIYFGIKILFYFVNKKNDKRDRIIVRLILMFALITMLLVVVNYNAIQEYLDSDFKNTIRMYALQKSYDVFKTYPVLGTGIGTFNGTASVKYNSYVYEMFNFNRFKNLINEENGNVFESYLAKVVIETGIVGIAFQIYCLYQYYRIAKKSDNLALLYSIFCISIYLILNKSYQIPYLIGVALLISYERNCNYKKNL